VAQLSFFCNEICRVLTYSLKSEYYSVLKLIRIPWSDGHSPSPPWRIYGKTSDMVNPLPSNLWVIITNSPDIQWVEDRTSARIK